MVKTLLWMKRVAIPHMHWIELVLTLAINARMWWSIANGMEDDRRPLIRPSVCPDKVPSTEACR